ncbi:MAG: ATP-binding protein [Gammaproteobacteria bacterium]
MSEPHQIAQIRFASHAYQLQHVRGQLRRLIEPLNQCTARELDCIILAVNEACMNIIQHAYGDGATGDIILEILNNKDELIFRIIDFADPVDQCNCQSRDIDELRPGGLGVYLINEVMDSVHFLECPGNVGNILELRKTISRNTEANNPQGEP